MKLVLYKKNIFESRIKENGLIQSRIINFLDSSMLEIGNKLLKEYIALSKKQLTIPYYNYTSMWNNSRKDNQWVIARKYVLTEKKYFGEIKLEKQNEDAILSFYNDFKNCNFQVQSSPRGLWEIFAHLKKMGEFILNKKKLDSNLILYI